MKIEAKRTLPRNEAKAMKKEREREREEILVKTRRLSVSLAGFSWTRKSWERFKRNVGSQGY